MEKKISQLNPAGTITGAEMVELVQGGLSVRSTVTNITVSSSYALTSSYSLGSVTGVPITALSASWVSASALITTAQTASYLSSSVLGDGIYKIQYISRANYTLLSPPTSFTFYVVDET
jgi:hypothetical protein